MSERTHIDVEWLKAQVEAYLECPLDSDDVAAMKDGPTLVRFVEYVEAKYQPKGIFDR